MRLAHVEGAVLGGGASTRMGRDKASLPWRDRPLAAHVAAALGACVERVRIVLRPGTPNPLALPRIDDVHGARAPLVGLHAALAACEAPAMLVAACDLPLVDPRLLLGLLALMPVEDGADAVVPCGPRGPEPLLAVYRPRLLPEIERRILAEQFSLRGLLADVATVEIPATEVRKLDPSGDSLRNVNRPEDLP